MCRMTTSIQLQTSVVPDVWSQLESELEKVLVKLKADELTPEDVKTIRQLKTAIDKHVKQFNSEITKRSKEYKDYIQQKLNELGFNEVEEYVKLKQEEQKREQNNRIERKRQQFANVIESLKEVAPTLFQTSLSHSIFNTTIQLFKDIMSGSKSKETLDFESIKTVLTHLVTPIEQLLNHEKLKDYVTELPLSSSIMQLIQHTLSTGDIDVLRKGIEKAYESDKKWFEDYKLKHIITDDKIALDYIQRMLTLDMSNEEKLNQIERILHIQRQNKFKQLF